MANQKRPTALLSINNLEVGIGKQEIVHGISLSVRPGEVHAIMGPNGSGKSTLVSTLMGHPAYDVTGGSVLFRGKKLASLSPDERARLGMFLAFQYPKEIAGISVRSLLFAAIRAREIEAKTKTRTSPIRFKAQLEELAKSLQMDTAFLERSVNKGFSGGEKKKAEVLQMLTLQPSLALLDETDSGLDVDALRIVADGVNKLRSPRFSAIVVTHYARLLTYLVPDHVHVMIHGKIVESGGPKLAHRLEKEGYVRYR
jgi:Fe-S cluster assembly ATP-binding protein